MPVIRRRFSQVLFDLKNKTKLKNLTPCILAWDRICPSIQLRAKFMRVQSIIYLIIRHEMLNNDTNETDILSYKQASLLSAQINHSSFWRHHKDYNPYYSQKAQPLS